MPKARTKRRPTEEEKDAILGETVSQLEALGSHALVLVCERLNIEGSHELTDVGRVEAIKGVHRWHLAVKRMLGTKKFADQLDLCMRMVERGIVPVTLQRMQTLWLWDFDKDTQTDHLRVLCAYVGVETSGTYLELIERLEAVSNINQYKTVMETPLWDARIANAAGFLASDPPKTNPKRAWLQKLSTDELKLMCSSLGISIDGEHFALFARLEEMADIDRYRGYLNSDWWRHAVNSDKLQERFAKYKPSSESAQQLMYSHVPTSEPNRQTGGVLLAGRLSSMSTHANVRAHKDALGTLAALLFDKKVDMNDQEYLEANTALMKLRETADALARSNSAAPAANTTNTTNTATRALADRPNFEGYVTQVNNNTLTAADLIDKLQRRDGRDGLRWVKVDVVQAIYELVCRSSGSMGIVRQTDFGAADAIETLTSELMLSHNDPTYPLETYQIKLLVTLDALVCFHASNKERFGAAGAFRVVTRFLRYGTWRVENVATKLLANASFQHDNNQDAMVAAGTVEAIVDLMGEATVIDRVLSFLRLLHHAMCNSKSEVPVVGRAAVDQGVIPVLLRLAGGNAAVKAMEVLYKIFDGDEAMRDKVVAEGGILRMTDVLKDPVKQLEERAMAAKLLGEMGGRAPANRMAIVARGVIPILKELKEEPTGRSRNTFAFALSRLDENEVDGIAAREVARAREAEAKSKALEEKRKNAAAHRNELVERAGRIKSPIAKKRARK